MSDIQDCIKYFIKKHETLTSIPHIHVYMNETNDKLVFEMKNGYELELITLEKMEVLLNYYTLLHQINFILIR